VGGVLLCHYKHNGYYVTFALTSESYSFCPSTAYMCFLCFSEQTTVNSLSSVAGMSLKDPSYKLLNGF